MSQTKPVPAWWQSTHFPFVLFFCFFAIFLLFRFTSFSVRPHTDSPLPTAWQLADFLRFQPSFKLTSLLLNIPSPTTPLGSSNKLTGYLRVSEFLRKSFSKCLSLSIWVSPPTTHPLSISGKLTAADPRRPTEPTSLLAKERRESWNISPSAACYTLTYAHVVHYSYTCCIFFFSRQREKKTCCIFKLENIPMV